MTTRTPRDTVRVKDPALIKALIGERSARQISRELDWQSHSYLNRILAGAVTTMSADKARDLARLLKVAPSVLFVPKASGDSERSDQIGRAS